MTTLGKPFDPVDLARHLIMPVTLLGLAIAAQMARYTRAALLEVMGSEYVMTARSKGLRAPARPAGATRSGTRSSPSSRSSG